MATPMIKHLAPGKGNSYATTSDHIISMAWCKTAVNPMR